MYMQNGSERMKHRTRSEKETSNKKKQNEGEHRERAWISALTKPLHNQVIYDIEIDDNFYYMHFRLNLRNKIVDCFFSSLVHSFVCSFVAVGR